MVYEIGAIALLFLFIGFVIGWITRGLFGKGDKKK
jgi:hypothetical protein